MAMTVSTCARMLVLVGIAGCGGGTEHDAAVPDDRDLAVVLDLQTPSDLSTLSAPFVSVNITRRDNAIDLDITPYAATCTRTYTDACEMVSCPSNTVNGYATGQMPDTYGSITLSEGAATTTFTPMPLNGTGSGGLMIGPSSAAVTVSTSGGTIPAFTSTVGVSSPIAATCPQLNAEPVSRTEGLTFSFSGAADTQRSLEFRSLSATTVDTVVHCTFPAGSTQGVVPAEALGFLPPGDAYVLAFGQEASELTSGSFDIRVRDVDLTSAADAGITQQNITFQ